MPRRRIPRPITGARNAAYRIAATLTEVQTLRTELAQTSLRMQELSALVKQIENRAHAGSMQSRDALLEMLERNRQETLEILQLLRDDEPTSRRLLWQARDAAEYEAAYEEAEPLVSVLIPTYTNVRGLVELALPAILAQTYEHLEVVVVGDAASPDVEQAVRSVGDKRVRYANLTHRGPYPESPQKRWLVAGGPPANEALRLARGSWIGHMDDDDTSPPERIEVLLRAARHRRLEFCYGRVRQHLPDGSEQILGEFPPRSHAVSLTCSLMHAGLSFIAAELGDSLFGIVGDWARVRRMMRIGARVGMIDDVVLDYYPSQLWRATDYE
jgi:hypothetical protein